jgi:hypothetical protein
LERWLVQRRGGGFWLLLTGFAALVVVIILGVSLVLPEVQKLLKLKEDVVRFQNAAQSGPAPFTPPADVRASAAAAGLASAGGGSGGADAPSPPSGGGEQDPSSGGGDEGVDEGTFGGTGKNHVCDREKLIKALLAQPDRLRAWAEALGIEPTREAVTAFIRKLRPVTLTKDTQVTNHSFIDDEAKAYQAILQKGTAVLVDKDGKPVTRCRCGNPLKEPVDLAQETECIDCPKNYKPPPPCDYYDYDDAKYQRYDDQDFKGEYDSSDFKGKCYRPNPEPPPVEEEGEPPPEEDRCLSDPSATGCEQQCEQDPTLSFCDGAQNGEETAPPEGGEETPTEETPSEGQEMPSEGTGGTSPDGGEAPSGGGSAP